MSPWWFEISRPAWAVRAAYRLVDWAVADPILAKPLNRLRGSYSLPPVKRVMDDWWLSPDRILAMYPQWFAPATRSFSPRLVHCGFPLADVDGDTFAAPTDQPIVFTAGTAHYHCRGFFRRAVDACVKLDRPGLLLSTHAENFPGQLPESVRTMPYASFGQLLPHCSAIVHHGGIGTTSQALAAGIPQIIRPLAFDQFDNATRVEALGCGRWLRTDKLLVDALQSILGERHDVRERAVSPLIEIASRLDGVDAPVIAAAEIEKLMREKVSP
jgi:UDP:flavonoid glycosyltransferase YjiC (YdhE family)